MHEHRGTAGVSDTHKRMTTRAEDDDEIVARIPVVLGPVREGASSCLLQYPLRPRWRPYDFAQLSGARIRPKQHQIEMDLRIPAYDGEEGEPPPTCQLTSTVAAHKTAYAMGLLHVGAGATGTAGCADALDGLEASLHLAPLDAVAQMRPTFSQPLEGAADGADAAANPAGGGGREEGGGAEGGGGGGGSEESVMPVFKRAETEKEEEARRSSHAYWLAQREAEPWRELRMHGGGDAATVEVRRQMFGLPS